MARSIPSPAIVCILPAAPAVAGLSVVEGKGESADIHTSPAPVEVLGHKILMLSRVEATCAATARGRCKGEEEEFWMQRRREKVRGVAVVVGVGEEKG